MIYEFKVVIPGNPLVQQRHRVGKWGGMYDPISKEKKQLGQVLLLSRLAHKLPIWEGLLSVEVYFYDGPHKRGQKPDIDNFVKALFDAGNKILWEDDSQIRHLVCSVERNSKEPRTELAVFEFADTEVETTVLNNEA